MTDNDVTHTGPLNRDNREIGVRASSGGRPITLDPIMETPPLSLERRRVESTIPCGFQIQWFDGSFEREGGTWTFDMAVGAGVGSRWMTICIKDPDGKTFAYECANMAEFTEGWIDAILTDGRSPDRVKECVGCGVLKGEPHRDYCPVVTGTLTSLPDEEKADVSAATVESVPQD